MTDTPIDILTDLMDGFEQLTEACVGHREMMLRAGFSETAAEIMTGQFHGCLLAKSLAS